MMLLSLEVQSFLDFWNDETKYTCLCFFVLNLFFASEIQTRWIHGSSNKGKIEGVWVKLGMGWNISLDVDCQTHDSPQK